MPLARRSLAAVAAVLLVASALAGCAADGPFAITASGTQELDAAVATTGSDLKVRVEMFNGPIEVRAGQAGWVAATVTTTGAGGSKADAEADRAKIRVSLDVNPDGSVLLRAVYEPRPSSPNNRTAGAVVEVPPGAALDLRTCARATRRSWSPRNERPSAAARALAPPSWGSRPPVCWPASTTRSSCSPCAHPPPCLHSAAWRSSARSSAQRASVA